MLSFSNSVEEAFDHPELDVAFEQRHPYVAQRFVDDVVVELGDTGESLPRGAESFGESLKHVGTPAIAGVRIPRACGW